MMRSEVRVVVMLSSMAILLFLAGGTLGQEARSKGPRNATGAPKLELASLRLAITDLTATFGERYPKGNDYLRRLDALEKTAQEAALRSGKSEAELDGVRKEFEKLRGEALLDNPLLQFDRLLLIKRKGDKLGLPQNWQGNSSIPRNGYDNEIACLSPVRPGGKLTTLYRPEKGNFVGDVDLHFDADRMLFSMPSANGRWQIFEIRADGSGLRQVTPDDQPDVDNFDPCYLPSGKIIFCSTANYQGVPCVGGGDSVALLYRMDADGKNIRQLTFDQDHNWCPTVLNNGRVLYTRWEYGDAPHYFSRILFQMNPDGTEQSAVYGSNSYWPNSIFYARPIPGSSKIIGIVSGHHGVPRMGELILFDPTKGRREADGVVQRIPGYGKRVEPIIKDQLVNDSWPRFLHPYPLSEKYFLVSCKPTPNSPWGVYLADVFDNLLPLCETEGYALFEPVPLRKEARPPSLFDRVDPNRKDALVFITDIYAGEGLPGVPRGTVKKLRVAADHFAYRGVGGHMHVGIDGPWDVKRILGTVPVQDDGSVLFRVPANTPIFVQPLDSENKAVQLMRSWFTAMPGETVTCAGCHQNPNSASPFPLTRAASRTAAEITPWYGPARGFSFEREVQPVLDRYCVGCHDGQPKTDGKPIADLRGKPVDGSYRGRFTPSYEVLHRYVRRPGPESDFQLLLPNEFHADTSELVQMLQKGHHNVKLDTEAWDRLITWIDLNVPCHGTWTEHRPIPRQGIQRRRELQRAFAGLDEDPEARPTVATAALLPVRPPLLPVVRQPVPDCPNWPFDAAEAKRRQAALGTWERKIDLGNGVTLDLVLVPAGEFLMGDPQGAADEQPVTRNRIDRPFWIGKFEITNEQFRLFDSVHDSRYINQLSKDQNVRGYPINGSRQPVVRVSWRQAMAYCDWLSRKTGQRFTLPTEAEWEYACRAGTATPFWYGGLDTDFGKLANLADASLRQMARGDSPDWIPRDPRFNDGSLVTANVGKYQPNPWGLCDMHGNAMEWTRSSYRPHGSRADDRSDHPGKKVVRGGSFYDRPARCRSAFRLSYPEWHGVYNVGFRVIVEAGSPSRGENQR